MQLEPYLFFEGRCDEALEFYKRKLGAEVQGLMRYNQAPEGTMCPNGIKPESVMHCRVRVGDSAFMASDGRASGQPKFEGFSISRF
jgi:PhnB protein